MGSIVPISKDLCVHMITLDDRERLELRGEKRGPQGAMIAPRLRTGTTSPVIPGPQQSDKASTSRSWPEHTHFYYVGNTR